MHLAAIPFGKQLFKIFPVFRFGLQQDVTGPHSLPRKIILLHDFGNCFRIVFNRLFDHNRFLTGKISPGKVQNRKAADGTPTESKCIGIRKRR